MKNYISLMFAILIFSCSYLLAQENENGKTQLTGNLSYDSKFILENYNYTEPAFQLVDESDKKSPVLAGVMSALVPGSGEFYLGDYLKAGIFFAVDVALIATAISYNNQGNTKEDEFKAFADEHWSVVEYAKFLNSNGADISINPDESLPPWERVNWTELNDAEFSNLAGVISSHHLVPHGEQQYYEVIGKYNQYIPGWPGGVDQYNPPQIMLDYAKMRGDANSAYNTASKIVIGVYINHLLSAIDAVWSAHRYNDNLAVNLRVKNIQLADRLELVPTVNFKYNF